MPQFLLIDHSLSGPGSHHYEYAAHVLAAAQQAGWDTVLAANRRLASAEELHAGRVLPVFPHSTYGGNSLSKTSMNGATSSSGANWTARLAGFSSRIRQWRHERRHEQRLAAFAAACQQVFLQVPLHAGDHVFLPTLSDFDLLGLARVLPRVPAAAQVQWHLQCHFSFLEGRETDYGRQSGRLAAMRERFQQALQPLAGLPLHFYSTTAQMAAQYNRTQTAEFEWLPYPVSRSFQPRAEAAAPRRPLRVVCAGRVRDEKGSQWLPQLIDAVWDDLLASGQVQLILQGNGQAMRRHIRKPVAIAAPDALAGGSWPDDPLVQAPFPLSSEGYSELIRQADVGLFLYDSYRYYGRCSGVLIEMLCSGVPVVVPAACWLEDELLQARSAYLARMTERAGEMPWRTCQASGRREDAPWLDIQLCTASPAAAMLEVESDAWHVPRTYLACEAAVAGQPLAGMPQMVSPPTEGGPARLLLSLPRQASSLRVRLWNAFQQRALPIQFRVRPLLAGGPFASLPSSAVGVAFGQPQRAADALREVVLHHAHYARTAQDFAPAYAELHSPEQALALLLAKARPERQAA